MLKLRYGLLRLIKAALAELCIERVMSAARTKEAMMMRCMVHLVIQTGSIAMSLIGILTNLNKPRYCLQIDC